MAFSLQFSLMTWLFFIPLGLTCCETGPWGCDANLTVPPQSAPACKPNMAVRIADAVICFHQTVLTHADGSRSHFRPTSSRYMQLAMQRYGFWRGFLMGCDRLLRENDEEWVYNTIEIDGRVFKYDPAWSDKHAGPRIPHR
jgi:putative component of membrane protein insertase Oxa1/YidC/SpoIIIJ protein YidD